MTLTVCYLYQELCNKLAHDDAFCIMLKIQIESSECQHKCMPDVRSYWLSISDGVRHIPDHSTSICNYLLLKSLIVFSFFLVIIKFWLWLRVLLDGTVFFENKIKITISLPVVIVSKASIFHIVFMGDTTRLALSFPGFNAG